MIHIRLSAAAILAAAVLFQPLRLAAQQAAPRPPATSDAAAAELPPLTIQDMVARLPPPPALPPSVAGRPPPSVLAGVVSVPEIMTQSLASQEVQKVLSERRQKLTADEQKEQTTLRDLGQQLANDRPKLTPEQIRAREKDLQDRLNDANRKFGLRNRVIQDAEQFCLLQIQRVMTGAVQQIAVERGMNMIIRREQVALNTADFDITPQAIETVNKVLPSVIIPPDGVDVRDMKPYEAPAAAAPAGGAAAPAAGAATAPAKH